MEGRMLTRRNLLGVTAAAAGAALLPGRAFAGEHHTLHIPPGLQLWTVKEDLARDFAGTLSKLAAMGYKRIEAAGWVGKTPADYAAGIRAAGLDPVACHFGMRDLWTDADTDKNLAAAKEVGVTYVVASSPQLTNPMPQGMPWGKGVAAAMTLAGWQANAERMNVVGAKAKALGMKFGYHNHAAEFLMYDGKLAWGEIVRITDPGLVVMELDLGWVAGAGVDPVEAIKLGGKRIHLLHVKDLKVKATEKHKLLEDETTTPIGKGTLDWKAIFAACDAHAAVHSWFVEQEAPFARPPLDELVTSIAYLKSLKA
jgi:sugar phosphate isomerase/epimerase